MAPRQILESALPKDLHHSVSAQLGIAASYQIISSLSHMTNERRRHMRRLFHKDYFEIAPRFVVLWTSPELVRLHCKVLMLCQYLGCIPIIQQDRKGVWEYCAVMDGRCVQNNRSVMRNVRAIVHSCPEDRMMPFKIVARARRRLEQLISGKRHTWVGPRNALLIAYFEDWIRQQGWDFIPFKSYPRIYGLGVRVRFR